MTDVYTKAEGDRLVDMYNRERERADKFEKLYNDEESFHGKTIDHRDAMEERVNAIGMQLGLSENEMEWSNLNDVGVQCIEAAALLEQRALKAEAELLKWESGEAEREMIQRYSKAEAAATAMRDALMMCRSRVVDVLHAIEHSGSAAERFNQPIVRGDLKMIDEALAKFSGVNPGR